MERLLKRRFGRSCRLPWCNRERPKARRRGAPDGVTHEQLTSVVGKVAALVDVDAVIIFPEADVRAIIREIRPDVHAKGTDYSTDTVPERAIANELGIQIAIVGDPKNHSTRALLTSVRKAPHG